MRYFLFIIEILVLVMGYFWLPKKINHPAQDVNKIIMEYAPTKARVDDISNIPQGAEKYLPARGFLFISGGFVSTSRRLMVDVDKNVLTYGIGRKNQTPYEKLVENDIILKELDLKNIISITNQIWASNDNFLTHNVTADFDVLLILSDSGKVRVIDSYGPPTDKVAKLYDLVWNLTSEK